MKMGPASWATSPVSSAREALLTPKFRRLDSSKTAIPTCTFKQPLEGGWITTTSPVSKCDVWHAHVSPDNSRLVGLLDGEESQLSLLHQQLLASGICAAGSTDLYFQDHDLEVQFVPCPSGWHQTDLVMLIDCKKHVMLGKWSIAMLAGFMRHPGPYRIRGQGLLR